MTYDAADNARKSYDVGFRVDAVAYGAPAMPLRGMKEGV